MSNKQGTGFRLFSFIFLTALFVPAVPAVAQPPIVVKPDAFETLVNPKCSHCRDEDVRRRDLAPSDRVLCWTRGYSDGGAIPIRFFLAQHRVISDSYGVFVYDPDAGYARGFAPSYEFRFHGWRNGVMVMKHADGTLYSCLSGLAFDGPKKGTRLKPIPTVVTDWGPWLKQYPNAVAYQMSPQFKPTDLPYKPNPASVQTRGPADGRMAPDAFVLGIWDGHTASAWKLNTRPKDGADTRNVDGKILLWNGATFTATAYKPTATAPDGSGARAVTLRKI